MVISTKEIEALTNNLSNTAITLGQQLQAQEQGLRRLGVGLPMGTLERLQSIHDELQTLTDRIQEQRIELAQLRTLANTSELVNSSLELDKVLEEVIERVIQLIDAERGYIMLRDPQTGELQPRVIRKLESDEEFIVSKTIVSRVVEQGETVITNNAMEDDRFMSHDSIAHYALRSIICVPLKSRDKVIGAIYCDNRFRVDLFGVKEKRLLMGFANQAAIAIENAQFFEQIKQALEEITEIKVLLDNILASIASGVITTDAEGRITTYNKAAASIFGIPEVDAIGNWLEQVLDFLYPHMHDELISVLQEDTSELIEVEIEIDDRGPLSLTLKLTPLKDAENMTQGIALVVDDLTELKQRDATLAAVRRYLPPAMVDNIASLNRLALGGERREVTIMYVEVRPFDTFPKNLTPRELLEWLNTYHTLASEAVHHHTGLIDKYMGNEIMCLFNTQLNPSDTHAWDALQTALRLAADFHTMAMYSGLEQMATSVPYYRIGINTGIATMGNVGSQDRREFSAIGDSVNLAHRLMENCQLGQIIIGHDTLVACREYIGNSDWITVKELSPIQVKGRVQPARIYEIFDAGT